MSKKIKTETTFIACHISKSDAMNAKITSNINLVKKLKKLGSRQETVLAGVADHLTEDEKSNINLVLSKIEQLSNNIKVEEDKLPNQHTSEKANFEAFFISFKHEIRAYEESDKMDCLMFSTVDYFRFKVDLYHSFNPKTNATSQISSYLRIRQIEYCYFLLVTVVSSIPKCEKIAYRRISHGKNISLDKNYHTQQ